MLRSEQQPQYILYDTTLRDGAQGAGVNFTTEAKLQCLKVLDRMGLAYIEGGWPGANPTDTDFFKRAQEIPLRSKLAAFGSTRRAATHVADDSVLQSLLDAGTPVCTLVSKSSLLQVERVLRTTPSENLEMIKESVAYLKESQREVGLDAEHFFDGFKDSPEYALETLEAAIEGGVDWITLCDTKGGTSMIDMRNIVRSVVNNPEIKISIGIHTHNDRGLAVANTLIAVEEGIRQIQGTINGYGERAGNADLITIIGNLQASEGIPLIPPSQLRELTKISQLFEQLTGCSISSNNPYAGSDAFAHKAGLHANGVIKDPHTYEHIEPELVGNERRFIVSEQGGTATMEVRIAELQLPYPTDKNFARQVSNQVKGLAAQGFQFEKGPASFEILVRRLHPEYKAPIDLKIQTNGDQTPQVLLKVNNHGSQVQAIELPVAKDLLHMFHTIKAALVPHWPYLDAILLESYKTQAVNDHAQRTFVELSDGNKKWTAVYAHTNGLQAAWLALKDAMEYAILHPSS